MSYMESFARRALAAILAFVMVFSLALVPIAATVAVAETVMEAGTTDPADDPTDPAGDPTDPVDDPTDPTDDPTDPADDPTDPVDDPTDPADDPTDPADVPTDPADDPTDPEDDPTEPADDPTDPADDPTDPEPTVIEITVKAVDNSKKYGDNDPDLTVSIDGNVAAGDKIEYTVVRAEGEDAGSSYAITVSGEETQCDGKYRVTYQDGTFTINKREVTLTSATDSKVYDGTPLKNDTVTVGGDGFAEGEGVTYNVTGSQTEVGSSKNAFTYTLNENTKADNYTITSEEGTLTVTAIKVTVMLHGNTNSATYDGSEHKIDGYTVDSIQIDGEDTTLYTEEDFALVDGKAASATRTNVVENEDTDGKTVMGLTGTDFENTKYGFEVTFAYTDGYQEITPATLTIATESATQEFNGRALTADGKATVGETETILKTGEETQVTLAGEEKIAVKITGSQTEPGESYNTYEITWGEVVSTNYTVSDTIGKLIVTSSTTALTIVSESDSKTYDGTALTAPTYTITYGENSGTATLNAETGKYEYELSTGDVVTITPAESATVTHVADSAVKNAFNYEIENASYYSEVLKTEGELSITPAELTINTDGNKKTYGSDPLTAGGKATFNETETTLVYGENTVALAHSETIIVKITGSQTPAGNSENTYEIMWGETASTDYTVSGTKGTLTVEQADPGFHFNNGAYTNGGSFTSEILEWPQEGLPFDFSASIGFNAFAEGERDNYRITYEITGAEEEDDASIIDNGAVTVYVYGEYTIKAFFQHIGDNPNLTDAELEFTLLVCQNAEENPENFTGNRISFDEQSIQYVLGTKENIVSNQEAKRENQRDRSTISYKLVDDFGGALSIDNKGEVRIVNLKSIAEKMPITAKVQATIAKKAKTDFLGRTTVVATEETITYHIEFVFADMPEGASYTVADPNGDNGWYVLNEGQNVQVQPHEGYKIGYDVLSFGESVEIEDQGDNVTETVYLRKIEDGGITAPIPVGPIKIDYESPIDVSMQETTLVSDILADTITLGFYQSGVTFTVTATDATSDLNRVEWTYKKDASATEPNKADEEGSAKFTNGTATFTLSGDYDGVISYVVYDNAGNSVAGEDGGRFVADNTNPVLNSVTYSAATKEHADEDTGGETCESVAINYYNIETLKDTKDENTVTVSVSITETNFHANEGGNKPTVKLKKDNGDYTATDAAWSDDGNGTLAISGDGHYFVQVDYTDDVGNQMTYQNNRMNNGEVAYQSGEIVIDSTSPKLEIAYSDPARMEEENGATTRYYGSGQDGRATITLTIEERNFSENRVDVNLDGNKPQINWSNEGVTHTGTFVITGDGDHEFSVNVTDQAGNQVSDKSCKIVIDTANPTINVSYSPNDIINSIGGRNYYKENQTATITITEEHFDPEKVFFDRGDGRESFTVSDWDDKNGNQHVAKVTFTDEQNFTFTINVKDKAENAANQYSHQLTVDKTPPTNVNVTVLGTSVSDTIDNVVFFKENVTVKVSASDAVAGVHSFQFAYNKDPEASDVNIGQLNKAISEGSFAKDENNIDSVTFVLPKDAAEAMEKAEMNGMLSVIATDRSGNSASATYGNTVVVDNTPPKMEVSFSDPSNDKSTDTLYYKEDAVGTIKITEANFYQEHVKVSATRNGEPFEVEIAWEKTGTDENTGTFTLSDEGDYTITVEYTDGSGNEAGTYVSKQIVVDKTANPPTVMINGTEITGEDGGVYAAESVKVEYEMNDLNLDQDGVTLEVLLTPSFREQEDVSEKRAYFAPKFEMDESDHKTTCKGSFDIKDIIDEEGNIEDDADGIYDLLITLNDLAGNTATKHIQLAVCRHGSVYQYDGDFAAKIGRYLKKQDGQDAAIAEDLVIYEYCPTNLATEEDTITITVKRDKMNVDTDIKREAIQEDPDKGWYQYKYVIDKHYFAEDGEYNISISSAYKAMGDGNTSVSHISSIGANNSFDSKGALIEENAWFVVDTHAPDIRNISNLEDSIINAEEITVDFTVKDDGGIKDVRVFLNGIETEVTKNGDVDDLYTFNGEFVINESVLKQDIRIVVTDLAGNETDTMTETFKEQIKDRYTFNDNVTVSTNLFVRWYANKPLFWGTVGGAAALASGAGAAVVVRRRKKGII